MAEEIQPIVLKKTLREQIVDVLRQRILRGELKPGERIIESEVAETFQVSRAPIREALRQLEEEGMVLYAPHKGCEVKTLSFQDIQDSYLIRSTLEVLAVRVCSGKLTDQGRQGLLQAIADMRQAARSKDLSIITETDERFHGIIVAESGCKRLMQMWKSLEGPNAATYYTMNRETLMPFEYIADNHQKILTSFETEHVEEIIKVIEEHYMLVPRELQKKQEKEAQNQENNYCEGNNYTQQEGA